MAEVGTVIQVADDIARIHGLENAMQNELWNFPVKCTGILNTEEDNVGAVLLGSQRNIREAIWLKCHRQGVVEGSCRRYNDEPCQLMPLDSRLGGKGGYSRRTKYRKIERLRPARYAENQ